MGNAEIFIDTAASRLTNTRYADDIIMYAKNLEELITMTESLIKALRKIGLRLNTTKTKILHTRTELDDESTTDDYDYVEINGEFVRVLPITDHHRYLGRYICMSVKERLWVEFRHRL